MTTVAWFSAGVSSAVAAKLTINEVDRVIYTHIDDQHPDTMRFVKDCEQWFGKEIEILQSPYKNVNNVIRSQRYINGPSGAPCTRLLKKKVRQQWEYEQPLDTKLRYVWGMDYNEMHRAERLNVTMPNQEHMFPLIDRRMSKTQAHEILKASGIKRPAMYDLGFSNNNCILCPKGGQGYANKCRELWPDIFAERAKLEREIGASGIKGIFLDELPPDAGRNEPMIINDCGILCELLAL